MLHMSDSTTALPHKEPFCDSMKMYDKGCRGRIHSDDFLASDASTAAPSPEASPDFGPQQSTPLCGPGALLLPELSEFELPEAEDPSEAEFELLGFDDDQDEEHLGQQHYELPLAGCCEAPCEDIEGQLLTLLSQLSSLRAEARQPLQVSEIALPKIPYPQCESGFLPKEFKPADSQSMPGHAETGHWAYAMAPRPGYIGVEPLNICLGPCGATLEFACDGPEASAHHSPFKTKALFRRRGRSSSPLLLLEEASTDSTRGRSIRRRRKAATW
jgi:hypothetical protein